MNNDSQESAVAPSTPQYGAQGFLWILVGIMTAIELVLRPDRKIRYFRVGEPTVARLHASEAIFGNQFFIRRSAASVPGPTV